MSRGFFGRLLFRKTKTTVVSRKRNRRTLLVVESLETRIVFEASAIGAITGVVGVDTNANGTIQVGEQVAGAQVKIYLDNGDGTFNAATDTLQTTLTTNANGQYSVNNLMSGNYFAVQCAGTFGGVTLEELVSPIKTVDGNGVAGQQIDDFSTDTGPVIDTHPPGSAVDDVFAVGSAIGGQRDLSAEILNGNSGDTVEIRTDSGRLLVNPDFFAVGEYGVTWDGTDANGAGLNPTGLGGVDLTDIGGTTGLGQGIALNDVSFDQPGAQITVRVYSGPGQFSQTVITGVTPGIMNDFFLPFSGTGMNAFTPAGGGGADFTNVGAVQLLVTATNAAMDGTLDSIGVVGLNPAQCNFVNEAPVPAIDLEKLTNGNQADLATDADVPVINVNTTSNVTWTYIVTNNGQVPLNNVQLTDDQIGSIGTANITNRSINADTTLDVGEVWTYTVTGTPIAGNYTNKGTVTGDGGGVTVMDMDTSNYRGIGPGIDIEKTTNGNQADLASDADVPQVSAGSTVTWVYTVTNTGSDPLTNVVVNDSDIGAVSTISTRSINGDNILDIGEVWTYTAVGVAIAGNYENAGTVTGQASDGTTVMDTDLSHYVGLQPNIDIEKSTNNIDADIVGTGPQVFVGSVVTFRYNVTNTGGVPLTNVVVTDDAGTTNTTADDFNPMFTGGDTNSDGMLDLNETWTYEATRTATLGPHTNIAVVRGTDAAGTNVDDADPSNHSAIAAPEIASKRRFLASSF